jgi:imidazolonepropionase-like amidohydrolase
MVARPQLDLGDPPIIRISTPEEARDLVRRELAHHPDYIKVWYIHRESDDLAKQEAIVRATAEEAHRAGVRLAVHATELVVAKSALRAGADYLVHSVDDAPVDDEFPALARRNHAIYCPTLFVIMGYRYALSNTWQATPAERRLADPQVLDAMHDLDRIPKAMIPERVAKLMASPPKVEPSRIALANLMKVRDAGIPIAMGTDAGNIGTLHGPSVFREMELMGEAGLTPLEVLRAATAGGALAMGMGAQIGEIAPGRRADLVLRDADPPADVRNLERIDRVVRGGHLFVPDQLARSIRAP